MRAHTIKMKPAWSNRFAMPTIGELRGGLLPEAAPVFDHARKALAELPGVVESLKWMGVPWSWSLVYGAPGEAEGWAFLIPEPGRLQVAASLPADRLADIPLKKLPRFVRDGLMQTQVVGRSCWPTWIVSTPAQVDEVARLVQGARAGAAVAV